MCVCVKSIQLVSVNIYPPKDCVLLVCVCFLIISWRNVAVLFILNLVMCCFFVIVPLFAVEHESQERKAHRVDVRTLQHSCILPLQVSGAFCVSL